MIDIPKDKTPLNISTDKVDFEQALSMTRDEIRSTLKNAPRFIRRQTGYLARSEGKNIRANAMLTVAIDEYGRISTDAIKAAAAVELLHLATLVHDDIIDNADKRRGMDTLHNKFGEKIAVLCGDYLFCLAFELTSSIAIKDEQNNEIKSIFPKYLTDILKGELRQNENKSNYELTERGYFNIISGKTAALFEASFHAGFILSDEPEAIKKSYLKIGRTIGLIFQLSDDCADYESSEKASKKPVLSDFRQGVITLPLIHALSADSTLRPRLSDITPGELKSAVKALGGLDYTHSKISGYHKRTKTLINSLDTSKLKKEKLSELLDKAARIPRA